MPDADTLRALIAGDGRDRAFVDAMIRMEWARTTDAGTRARLYDLHVAVREAALRSHGALRSKIATGALRGADLRRQLEAAPPLERDHFVEEVLGIAYPPLDEPALERELVSYS